MIEAISLSKKFGDSYSVRNVSFEVKKGDILGFLGPNGAGKSTTMKMLTGLLQPSEGEARIAGRSVSEPATRRKGIIGYLPEAAPVYGDMSVEGFLRFMCGIKGLGTRETRREIDRTLGLVNLTKERNRLLRNLSKGTRQRAAIAQAILGSPPVIVLDEPTAGLDPSQINDVRKLIRNLGAEHAVIFSTHILPEVELTCNRILIIASGRIAVQGSADELTGPAATGVEVLVRGEEEVLRALAEELKSAITAITRRSDGLLSVTFDHHINRPELAKKIVSSGLELHRLSEGKTRLEEVFLRAIGKET